MASDICARLRSIGTATLITTMQKMPQHLNRVFMEGLRPLGSGDSVAGPARTVRFMARREDISGNPRGQVSAELIDSLKPGEVLVVDALGDMVGAALGDNHATRLNYLKAAACVIDGAARDTNGITKMRAPFWTRGVSSPGFGPSDLWPWEKDIPIHCAGVYVEPGDYIVADADGVIVVPKALAEEVATLGEEQVVMETYYKEKLNSGKSIVNTYPLPESARQEFEEWRRKRK